MAVWPYWVLALALLSALRPYGLTAQSFSIGPQVIFGDYREVSADLAYRGSGVGGAMGVTFKKATLEVALGWLTFKPTDDALAVEEFEAQQLDARLRYHVTGGVSAEIGITNRVVAPDFAAQSAGAVRVGARVHNAIGRGVRVALRGHYLAGAKFSGGGSAPLGMEVGLGAVGEFLRSRLRLTADYEFQYFNRTTDDGTGEVSVPIQQALVRLGAAVTF